MNKLQESDSLAVFAELLMCTSVRELNLCNARLHLAVHEGPLSRLGRRDDVGAELLRAAPPPTCPSIVFLRLAGFQVSIHVSVSLHLHSTSTYIVDRPYIYIWMDSWIYRTVSSEDHQTLTNSYLIQRERALSLFYPEEHRSKLLFALYRFLILHIAQNFSILNQNRKFFI